jgi:hypothetical protein
MRSVGLGNDLSETPEHFVHLCLEICCCYLILPPEIMPFRRRCSEWQGPADGLKQLKFVRELGGIG